jgi:catechol 2,3-dioxygenase-like lactoylglutathione lyase family enzyme
MLKKIHHVGIVVRNLEEAFGFYKDTLGLPLHKMATIEDQGVKAALTLASLSFWRKKGGVCTIYASRLMMSPLSCREPKTRACG